MRQANVAAIMLDLKQFLAVIPIRLPLYSGTFSYGAAHANGPHLQRAADLLMQQVMRHGQQAFCAEVPRPVAGPNDVLVEAEFSFISAGTEAAVHGPHSGATDIPQNASVTARALRLGMKAMSQPRRALRIGAGLMRQGRLVQAVAGMVGAGASLSGGSEAAPAAALPGYGAGYSLAGVVRACGDAVLGFAIGERVACAGAGRANHAEFVSVPANLCVRIPPTVAARDASSVALGAIAMQGVRRADARLGEHVAVIGLGFLGLMTVQMLRAAGVSCWAVDPAADRAALAAKFGARAFSEADAFAGAVLAGTGGHGADATIIAASSSQDSICEQAMKLTRRKGRVVVVGDVGLGLKRAAFYAKEIDFLISCSYGPGRYDPKYEEHGWDYPYAYVRWTEQRNMACYLDLLASGSLDASSLITAEYPISQAAAAYRALHVAGTRPIGSVLRYPSTDGTSTPRKIAHQARPRTGTIGVALVGTGGFAQGVLLPHLSRQSEMTVRAVVSGRAADSRNLSIAQGIEQVYGDLDAAFADPLITAVCIANRHDRHAAAIIAAISAGRAVFCEKPVALTWAELEAIDNAVVGSTAASVMVGFNRRFSPAITALRGRLQDRRTPFIAQYRMNAGALPVGHWVNGPEGGGRNLGEACHIYDLFGFLAGSAPVSITAQGIAPVSEYARADENFIATIRFSDGSVCALTYSSLGDQALGKERLELYCDGVAYVLDDYTSLTAHGAGRSEELLRASSADKGHAREIDLWAKSLRSGDPAPISWAEIRQATAIALWVEDLIHGRLGANAVAIGEASTCAE